MATTLQKQLRPASFRGVPFEVEASDFAGGRRAQLDEYVQRDKPYVEDLGRATREVRFSAFVVGPDYIDKVKALMKALETEGPGTLVHPWFGSMQASLMEKGNFRFSQKLGHAYVDLFFVESGALEFPGAKSATQNTSRGLAGQLESAAQNAFGGAFSIAGMPQFVLDAASGNIAGALSAVSGVTSIAGLASGLTGGLGSIASIGSIGALLGYAQNLAGAVLSAQGLLSNPLGLASTIGNFLGLGGVISAGTLIFSTGEQLLGVIGGLISMAGGGDLAAPAPASATPQAVQAADNAAAINSLVRVSVLAQAVGLSADMEITVYQDAVTVRDTLCAALDAECLTAPDTVYSVLQDARAAVYTDITERARDSARLVTYTPPAVVSALALAYDRYEDANRDLEICARNRIPRPGFVQAHALQLLSA